MASVLVLAGFAFGAAPVTALDCEEVGVAGEGTMVCLGNIIDGAGTCEPAGAQTVWIVEAEHDGGILDEVMVSALCDGSVIASCTAAFPFNPCQDSSLSSPGDLGCQARVTDNPDTVPITAYKASCHDPADPYRVIPMVYEIIRA